VKLSCAFALVCGACTTANPFQVTSRFVKTDAAFAPAMAPDFPDLLADESEVAMAMPFRSVGVLEVRGKASEKLERFIDRALTAGADLGCEVIVQRDLFELGSREWIPGYLGPQWRGNNIAAWQFLCGVSGVTEEEAKTTRRTAVLAAAKMRDDELGELCTARVPTGSHIRKSKVCGR
jgi:hypothetical protein